MMRTAYAASVSEPVFHLVGGDLERALAQVAGFVGEYWRGLQENPDATRVLSEAKPGDIARLLPLRAPQVGVPLDEAGTQAMLEEVRRVIMPGITHWQHPSFFAFFPANASGPAMLGELLCAGLGVQGMLWATSPACTELETRVLDWLGVELGLPAKFLSGLGGGARNGGGVMQGTASEAAVAAVVAARHRTVREWKGRYAERAARGERPHLTLYASEQAHSSIAKAAMVTGHAEDAEDRRHLRLIAVDSEQRMRVDALAAALREDVSRGNTPCFVCATVGTTGTTAIDDVAGVVREVLEIAKGDGVAAKPWVHVDAAHAGAACICPEFQHWLAGMKGADSFCMNPHKWLLTNFDCDCFWTSDRESLTASMSISPAYLRNAASDGGSVIDYRDWHVPLGRRFRALKLWLVMKHYGVQGLQHYIREHVALAAELEEWAKKSERWVVAAKRTMNLVCLAVARREGESDAARNARTKQVMDAVNASGKAYCTHTVCEVQEDVDGVVEKHLVLMLRVVVGGTLTEREHVQALWKLLQATELEQAAGASGMRGGGA